MKHLRFALAIAAIVILAGMLAVDAMGIMPSQPQIAACEADARRLCGPLLGGPIDAIRACMEKNKSKLSEQCRQAVK